MVTDGVGKCLDPTGFELINGSVHLSVHGLVGYGETMETSIQLEEPGPSQQPFGGQTLLLLQPLSLLSDC